MIIGVPTETLTAEYQVGLLPENVSARSAHHQVVVQSGGGRGVGIRCGLSVPVRPSCLTRRGFPTSRIDCESQRAII